MVLITGGRLRAVWFGDLSLLGAGLALLRVVGNLPALLASLGLAPALAFGLTGATLRGTGSTLLT